MIPHLIMKMNKTVILSMIILISNIRCYIEITDYHKHFENVYSNDYVLVVFHNPKNQSQISKSLKSILSLLDASDVIKSYNVLIEYIDIEKTTFFDNHYDLEGRETVKFFIRNQMIELKDYPEKIKNVHKNANNERELADKIEKFVLDQIKNISIELKDIEHFKELLGSKGILGLYAGANDNNFKRYHHVTKKNIDFTFVHTFDPYLREIIFSEFAKSPLAEGDVFAIIRSIEGLNEFDDQIAVTFNEFDEKALTEFLEYERFDKLRTPDKGNEIVKRMFFKAQPLLLYVKGQTNDSQKFEIFKEAVKSLPKRFIYSYTDTDSVDSGAYLQLFMMSEKMMAPETLSIIWVSPSRKVRIEPYNGDFTKQSIMDYVFNFYDEHEQILDSMKAHLYDKETKIIDDKVATEEL